MVEGTHGKLGNRGLAALGRIHGIALRRPGMIGLQGYMRTAACILYMRSWLPHLTSAEIKEL